MIRLHQFYHFVTKGLFGESQLNCNLSSRIKRLKYRIDARVKFVFPEWNLKRCVIIIRVKKSEVWQLQERETSQLVVEKQNVVGKENKPEDIATLILLVEEVIF